MAIQLTLLQLVQDMLSAIGAESVSTVVSGSTTEDALLAVNLANRTYEDLISKYKWEHLKTYGNLAAGSNLNELKGASGTLFIEGEQIYYGSNPDEQRVYWKDPEDFIRMTIGRNTSDSNVQAINNIKVYNDRNPTYVTTFDDETLVFDAIPDGSGLVTNDSYATYYAGPTARLSADAGQFDMPANAFPILRDFCIANAFAELAEDDINAARYERKATNLLNKFLTQGRLVKRPQDLRRKIPVRRAGTHNRVLIL